MSKDNPAPSGVVPPPVLPYPHVNEAKKASFWISQVFVLVATVLGVYLASSQGFKQALAYGEVQAAKTNYYLRKSLRSEIATNLPLVREYAERIGTGSPSARSQPIDVDTFVWECLKSSPATLETPSELLAEGRKFYRDVADLQKKIASGNLSIGVGKEQLDKVIAHMEKEVLPMFDADLKGLQNSLRNSGITVN